MGLVKLFLRKKPKIKIQTVKKDSFSGWIKCQGCNEMIHHSELSENEFVCNKCGFHYRMSAPQRVAHLIDKGTFQEVFSHLRSRDPLRLADDLPPKIGSASCRERGE